MSASFGLLNDFSWNFKGNNLCAPNLHPFLKNRTLTTTMQTIFEIGKTKNGELKPINLYFGKKRQESVVEPLPEGSYALILHTTNSLMGGKHGLRYIAVDVHVTYANEETILRDIYKLHGKLPTTAIEFIVPKGEQGKLHLIYETHAPFGPMRFMARLYRNTHEEILSQPSESVQALYPFQSMTFEDILRDLQRPSPFRDLAMEQGMIRPFLYIVSMHPSTRYSVADGLKLKLFGSKGSGDSHAEAWMIIHKNLRGLQASTSHSYESVNPIKKNPDWYQCLYRSMTEIYPSKTRPTEQIRSFETTNTLDECKSSSSQVIHNLELAMLQKMFGSVHHSTFLDSKLESRVDSVIRSPDLYHLSERLRENGLDDDTIFRGLIELCFLIYKETIKFEEGEHQKLRDKQIKHEIKTEKKRAEKEGTTSVQPVSEEIVPDLVYDLGALECLSAIKCKLLAGTWDPRGMNSTFYKVGRKGGQVIASWAIKKFILVPFAPFLILPYIAYRIALKPFIGSHLESVYIAIAQILLQRVLLSIHGINIDRYY